MTHHFGQTGILIRERISVWSGVGKSGHAARLLAATAATSGLQARYAHAEDLLHGELSALRPCDVLVAVSWSGRSQQIGEIIKRAKSATVLITGPGFSSFDCLPDHLIECDAAADTLLNGIPAESVLATLQAGYSLIQQAATEQERREALRLGHPHGALAEAVL